jgi:hypothetical protein
MKIRSINILSLIMIGFVYLLGSCEEKDDYNFSDIEPVIFSITGPSPVPAHGLTDFPFRYHVPHRGGSTFEWSVSSILGRSATIVLDDEYSSIAYITFDQSSVEDLATISVTETTMGGKKSPVFTRDIVLDPFCPYDMDELVGEWTGTSGAHDPVLTASTTINLNQLAWEGLAGFVNFSWGENWTSGGGIAIMDFSCGDVVTIPNQKIGETDYPDVYRMEGEGTFDPETKTITLTYEVFYADGAASAGEFTTVLTKDGIKSVVVPAVIPEKN